MKEKEQRPIQLMLGIRMALLIVGVSCCLTAAALAAGVHQYSKMLVEANELVGYELGRSAAILTDQEHIMRYVDEVRRIYESAPSKLRDATTSDDPTLFQWSVEDGEYEELFAPVKTQEYLADQALLAHMAWDVDVADISIYFPDYERSRMVFVMCALGGEEYESLYAEPGFWSEEAPDVFEWDKNGSSKDTGYHYVHDFTVVEGQKNIMVMSSLVPFFHPVTGETVAYVMVERPWDELDTNRWVFLSGFLLAVGIITVLLVVLSQFVLRFAIIRPLKQYVDVQTQIATELGVAQRIQTAMLPGDFPLFPERTEFDLYASMTPAKEVGGDLYDAFLIDDDHLCMIVGDVSGKGIPASLFMAISQTKLRDRAKAGGLPSEILSDVNDSLCESNKESMFVTVWLGILTISDGVVVMANAGHEYPVFQKGSGDYELIKTQNGFVLGAMPGMVYEDFSYQMDQGDTLFMYSDGLPEATDAAGKRLELEGMLAALNAHKDEGVTGILTGIKDEVDVFVGSAPQFDDLTMLIVRYNGAEGE